MASGSDKRASVNREHRWPTRAVCQRSSRTASYDQLVIQRAFRRSLTDTGLASIRGRLLARPRPPHQRAPRLQTPSVVAADLDAEFAFLSDPMVDATNWRAEHADRPAVIPQRQRWQSHWRRRQPGKPRPSTLRSFLCSWHCVPPPLCSSARSSLRQDRLRPTWSQRRIAGRRSPSGRDNKIH